MFYIHGCDDYTLSYRSGSFWIISTSTMAKCRISKHRMTCFGWYIMYVYIFNRSFVNIYTLFLNILDLLCHQNVQPVLYRKNTVQKEQLIEQFYINIKSLITNILLSVLNILVCSKQINRVNHSIRQHHPTSAFKNIFYIQYIHTAIFTEGKHVATKKKRKERGPKRAMYCVLYRRTDGLNLPPFICSAKQP